MNFLESWRTGLGKERVCETSEDLLQASFILFSLPRGFFSSGDFGHYLLKITHWWNFSLPRIF